MLFVRDYESWRPTNIKNYGLLLSLTTPCLGLLEVSGAGEGHFGIKYCGGPETPNFLFKLPLIFYELRNPWKKKKSHATLKYEAVGGSHFFGLAIYTTSGECFIHICRYFALCRRNLLSLLNLPVFKDRGNAN